MQMIPLMDKNEFLIDNLSPTFGCRRNKNGLEGDKAKSLKAKKNFGRLFFSVGSAQSNGQSSGGEAEGARRAAFACSARAPCADEGLWHGCDVATQRPRRRGRKEVKAHKARAPPRIFSLRA